MAITLAVAGLRSSYLDNGALSPIPFRNMPFRTQQSKKYLVDPKHTVMVALLFTKKAKFD